MEQFLLQMIVLYWHWKLTAKLKNTDIPLCGFFGQIVPREEGWAYVHPLQVYPGEERGFSIPVWGIYQYVYNKTRPSFLDRGILAQTVKEERNISNGSDSLGSR